MEALANGGRGGGNALGVARPEGDPGALESVAGDLLGAAGVFQRFGATLAKDGDVYGWDGLASFAFQDRCVTEASAVSSGAAACHNAATVVKDLAHQLRVAQKLCDRALADALEADARRARAVDAGETARTTAAAYRTSAAAAAKRATMAEATGTPSAADRAAETQANTDAATAAGHAEAADRAAGRAADDLETARRAAARATAAYDRAARGAAKVIGALASLAPNVTAIDGIPVRGWTGDPTAPQLPLPVYTRTAPPKPQDDDSEHGVGGFFKGLGKGAWEGVKGIGDAAWMGVKSGPMMSVISPDTFNQQWGQNVAAAKAAYHHPGELGKALVNWDDLSHGRYGEWLGNLAPDAAAALATGGTAAVATRGAEVARSAADFSKAARALERVEDTHAGLGAKFADKVSSGEQVQVTTLSGWKDGLDGYTNVSPHDVKAYSDKIGHEPRPVGGPDQVRSPDGFPGKWNSSHAEKQAALATPPGTPLAVTKDMCRDCQDFFVKRAIYEGQPQIVQDPSMLRVFMPDGTVLQNPAPGAVVPPAHLHPGAAAAGGTVGGGAQGIDRFAGATP